VLEGEDRRGALSCSDQPRGSVAGVGEKDGKSHPCSLCLSATVAVTVLLWMLFWLRFGCSERLLLLCVYFRMHAGLLLQCYIYVCHTVLAGSVKICVLCVLSMVMIDEHCCHFVSVVERCVCACCAAAVCGCCMLGFSVCAVYVLWNTVDVCT